MSTSLILPAKQLVVRATWAALDRKEKDYLHTLENELYKKVKIAIQFGQERVVVYIRRELSDNAMNILELSGYKIQMEKERYVSGGIVHELYRNAIVLD